MRALITGISGQLGWYLASLLQSDGAEVWGLVPPQAGVHLIAGGEAGQVAAALPGVQVVAGDVLDPWSLLTALETARPDVVFALGAVSQPNLARALPDLLLQINSLGVARLLEACWRVVPQARVVHASSDCIFGAQPGVQHEATPLAPVSPYGLSKAWAHLAVQVARERGQWAANAILFNATSPRQTSGLVPYLLRQLAAVKRGEADHVTVDSVGLCRDWLFAGDAARGFMTIAARQTPADMIVASGSLHLAGDWLAIGMQALDLEVPIHEVPPPGWTPEPYAPLADATRLHGHGWSPQVPFRTLAAWMTLVAAGVAPNAWWPTEKADHHDG